MSRNSKNRQRHIDAKARNRTKGYKGPARTAKQHTKRKTWYSLLGTAKAVTTARQILADAGAAGE